MRLVTRGNLGCLTSAVLVTECEPIQSIKLIHPQDIIERRGGNRSERLHPVGVHDGSSESAALPAHESVTGER